MTPDGPDYRCLFERASEQQGYFTASQARACGVSWDLLSDGARRGRYQRFRRGLYRLRDYPTSPREHVMAAWLAAGKDAAVVSHETALDLLDLSDIIPGPVHLTVPRSRRYTGRQPGVMVHTITRPFQRGEVTTREGIRVTGPVRTILDAAEYGAAPDQIELAVRQAIRRGMTTEESFFAALDGRSERVRRLVAGALESLIQ